MLLIKALGKPKASGPQPPAKEAGRTFCLSRRSQKDVRNAQAGYEICHENTRFLNSHNLLDNKRLCCYGDSRLFDDEGRAMQTTNNTQTRWTVSVSKETDTALRCFLAQRGMKKGDMSKFIEESVKWRVFDQSITDARANFADVPSDDLQALIDEATQSVKNEMRQEFSGKKA